MSYRAVLCALAVAFPLAASAAPVPKKQGEEVFLIQVASVPKLLSMDGKILEERECSTLARLSPGGTYRVSIEWDREGGQNVNKRGVIRNRAGEEVKRFDLTAVRMGYGCRFVWSPDGGRLLVDESPDRNQFVRRVYDLKSKEFSDVSMADGYCSGWTADGKRLLATIPEHRRLAWLSLDGKGESEFITPKDEWCFGGQLSPDETKMLYLSKVETKYKYAEFQLFVFDLKTKKRSRVTTADDGAVNSYCWSPDGKRVAYTWRQAYEKPDDVTECDTKLITSNPDGSDPKTVFTLPYKGKGAAGIGSFELWDWR